jgi:NAD(P)-dependent dehydrogenase (short-subunit alcohol dehydrogenase family)
MGKLDGKVAVITGAASGIGRASASRFAQEGAAVVIADLDEHGGAIVAGECVARGGRAVFHRTDVAIEADIQAAIGRAVGEYGRLDIMFNNAGLPGAIGPIETIEAPDWDRTIAILLRAAYLGMKHAIPELRKAGGGSIISTSSAAGLRGLGNAAAYSAAKAGLVTLTQAVAIEVGSERIRVNCICPGAINTPMVSFAMAGGAEEAEARLERMQPLPRAGHAEDVAAAALFLASEESAFITGTALSVDGGFNTGNGWLGARDQRRTDFRGPSYLR